MGILGSFLGSGGLGLVGDVLGGLFGSSSAKAANRTNIKLQREQQAWEQMMSNTAVQRRADDIEKAGGNRALAFVNGSEASTPSVAPARVDPSFRPEWLKGSTAQAQLARLQMDQMKANIALTSAQSGKTNAERQIIEEITGPSSAEDLVAKRQRNALFDQTMRKEIAEADISEQTAQLLKDKSPLILGMLERQMLNAEQQGRIFRMDADSMERMVEALGVKGKDAGQLMKIITTIVEQLARSR